MSRASLVSLIAGLAIGVPVAQGGVIDDASFFSSIPHTLIDFETDGSGDPVIIAEGFALAMPPDEYAAEGISFAPAIAWVNDGGSDFDAAQKIGGSADIAIPSLQYDDFVIGFLVPTRAFGLWVVNNNRFLAVPSFEVRDTGGSLIKTVAFADETIDGTVGVADYGFLGFAADEDIGSVRITKDAAVFDDLRFSAVPEPTTLVLLCVGAGSLALRRTRVAL